MRSFSLLLGYIFWFILYILNKHQKPEHKISASLKMEMESSRYEPIIVSFYVPYSSCQKGYHYALLLSRELKEKFDIYRIKISGNTLVAALTVKQIEFVSKKRWVNEIYLARYSLSFHEDRVRQECQQRGELDQLSKRLEMLREFYTV